MTKSKRQEIYDWIAKHDGDYGAVYKGKQITVSYADYDRIRIRIKNGYPYAELEKERVSDNKINLLIRIKEQTND